MDVVIPFRKSLTDEIELHFCLRAIEKYLPELQNLFIIGTEPTWIRNHIYIPATDHLHTSMKASNIFQKLVLACNDKRVSDDFYCTADDVFLLRPYVKEYNHKGLITENAFEYSSRMKYKQVLLNTMLQLNGGYDIGHGPIVYNKDLFLRSVAKVNWNIQHGFSCKALYCNINNLVGEFQPDCKISSFHTSEQIDEKINGKPYFSINDYGLNQTMIKKLTELYPVKSQFEK